MTADFRHTYRPTTMDITRLHVGATRIVLGVHPDAQPIQGWLESGTGQPELFTGWLELTRALERLISEAARRAAPPPDRLVR